jgi:hypothetical protein
MLHVYLLRETTEALKPRRTKIASAMPMTPLSEAKAAQATP